MAQKPAGGDIQWVQTESKDLDVMGSSAEKLRCAGCKANFMNLGKLRFRKQSQYNKWTKNHEPECERCVLGDDAVEPEKISVSVKLGKKFGKCGFCEKDVVDKYAKPNNGPLAGKYYHRECFACKECSKAIGDEPYAYNGEIVLCQGCAQNNVQFFKVKLFIKFWRISKAFCYIKTELNTIGISDHYLSCNQKFSYINKRCNTFVKKKQMHVENRKKLSSDNKKRSASPFSFYN
ncbi:four and a half LIM domains protein 3-like isoform 3 [Reticulomyxa filosa]|uniref:Four and a half LIM domains protein 3-like isoform 3 n=1 Tax=Reticulomyxa filosa TaxID=46433 RepID=X6MQL7_RETFI|nr:four and a half LIM domains protein 3-like isoform 3 [Reticulomyxa filosa]|eukprot:ETO15360.1 four and a half LIM domains protein 3-like isoform 3 [Reticulomyxa filosa]